MQVFLRILLIVASPWAISVESGYFECEKGTQCTLTNSSPKQRHGHSGSVQVESLPQNDFGEESTQRHRVEENATSGDGLRHHLVTSGDRQIEHRDIGSSFQISQTNASHTWTSYSTSQQHTSNTYSIIQSPQTLLNPQPTASKSQLVNEVRSRTTTESPSPEPSNILFPPDCGVFKDFSVRISSGSEVKTPSKWPWMVAYGYTMSDDLTSPMSFLCGGVLVTPKSSITAAHCADKAPLKLMYARFGDLDLKRFDEAAHVTKVVDYVKQHHFFNKEFIHDIAIVVTKEPVDFTENIAPICLPVGMHNESFEGRQPFIAGWGRLGFNKEKNSKLHDAVVPIVSNEQCTQIYRKQNKTVRRVHICAGGDDQDACRGDSGGPLMVPVDQHFYTIGVVSFGFQCGVKGYPGVYTRVTSYLYWLQTNLI